MSTATAGVGDELMASDSPRLMKDYVFSAPTPRDDTDNEILDLDCLTDDDESWLYATPAGKDISTDISAWLRKDTDNLDPETRRALAVKLESYLRRKNSATSDSGSLDSFRKLEIAERQNVQSKSGAKSVSIEVDKEKLNVSKSLGHNTYNLPSRQHNANGNFQSKNADLNLDLKDIQLLASMQEQDLRQCLQQTNNRRKETPEHHAIIGTPPKSGFSTAADLRSTFNSSTFANVKYPINLNATFVKPAIPAKPVNLQHHPPKSVPAKLTASRKSSGPHDSKKCYTASSSVEKHIGLRKSLPNLAASRSGDFSLPPPPRQDCSSEKGSYGDIPNVISPAGSSNKISSNGSRLPTPSRRSATIRTSSTPLSRSGIPVPKSRTKSPAPKFSLQTRLVDRYNWSDGCI